MKSAKEKKLMQLREKQIKALEKLKQENPSKVEEGQALDKIITTESGFVCIFCRSSG